MEHTPGPWEARSRGLDDGTLIVSSSDGELAVIRNSVDRTFDNNDRDVANARLIAAAPALLEALEGLRDAARRIPGAYTGALAEPLHLARAAIKEFNES